MVVDRVRYLAAAAVLLCIAVPPFAFSKDVPGTEPLPEFPEDDAKARKAAFFEFLRPIVEHQNAQIRAEREWLLGVVQTGEMNWLDRWRRSRLAERYRVSLDQPEEVITEKLVRRVDVLPVSLVLSQAAKESGWGRSRFAREGNALFGQRCFEAGCGIMPKRRVAGAKHEVEAFENVAESVASYLNNLNTHERYAALRRERQRLRELGRKVLGSALALHATHYSERREDYVREIVRLIKHNGLEDLSAG